MTYNQIQYQKMLLDADALEHRKRYETGQLAETITHNRNTESETSRHNLQDENLRREAQSETARHNRVYEEQQSIALNETQRHNQQTESIQRENLRETNRHNLVSEDQSQQNINELARSHQVNEQIGWFNAYETQRSHRAQESLKSGEIEVSRSQAATAQFNAETNRMNAQTNLRDAATRRISAVANRKYQEGLISHAQTQERLQRYSNWLTKRDVETREAIGSSQVVLNLSKTAQTDKNTSWIDDMNEAAINTSYINAAANLVGATAKMSQQWQDYGAYNSLYGG